MKNIICESELVRSIPKNIKTIKNGRVRMECVLQTVGDVNRNKRRYSRQLMQEGINKIDSRVNEGSFLGELDHPIDKNPNRQVTVLFKDASHRILDLGWDGNKLVGVLETLRTPKGVILKNLSEDGIPVGFSFRGMGDIRTTFEEGQKIFDVTGPLHVVTWDAVSYPSHAEAKIIKITEGVMSSIQESAYNMQSSSKFLHESSSVRECNGLICTQEGVCYLPEDWDRLVDKRVVTLIERYKLD